MSHFTITEHTLRCQHIRERRRAVEPGREKDLRLAVKQYVPRDNLNPRPGDVTLIGAHANGFPKELYEPLWDEIYEGLRAIGLRIRGIWIADVAHQGQSGVLNERILGDDPSWWDHGRDLLQLVNQFHDDIPHPIIGVGHSMGGMQVAHLSLMHPSLFQSLILIDAVIQIKNPNTPYALASTFRREIWGSREEAARKFRSSPFYQAWDTRVLQKWIDHGLRRLPTELFPDPSKYSAEAVTLTTTKAQEVFAFLRPAYTDTRDGVARGNPWEEMYPEEIEIFPFYRPEPPQVFRRLPELKPSVLWICGGTSALSTPDARRRKLEMTGVGPGGSGGVLKGRVQEAVIPCGHLVPMERVAECAKASVEFIRAEIRCWRAQEAEVRASWKAVPHQERIRLDKQWVEHIGTAKQKL